MVEPWILLRDGGLIPSQVTNRFLIVVTLIVMNYPCGSVPKTALMEQGHKLTLMAERSTQQS